MNDKTRELEKQLERLQQKLASSQAKDLINNVRTINGQKVLIATLQGMDGKRCAPYPDDMKSKLADGIVVLASVADDKIAMTATVKQSLDRTYQSWRYHQASCRAAWR